jgi:imidazole glycerol phosphate synthase glutamine amidotransferase subunit
VTDSITVIDYGVGNLGSVVRAFKRLGVDVELTSEPSRVGNAKRLVLPGVGHFGESMTNLRDRGLDSPISDALEAGARLLGICVGFQMLFESSEEAPGVPGLGLLDGEVRRFPPDLTVPHIGWNQLEDIQPGRLLDGIGDGDYFYFLHSYYAVPAEDERTLARTDYGLRFCSVAGNGDVAGIQFHPEKSQDLGRRVLENFCQRT